MPEFIVRKILFFLPQIKQDAVFTQLQVGETHSLLIEGGLTLDAIKKSVAGATIAFRDGGVELFEFLEVTSVSVF